MNNQPWVIPTYNQWAKLLYINTASFPKFLLWMLFLVHGSIAFAQLEVTTDRPTADYQLGETVNFAITSPWASGQATYTIHADERTPNYKTGTITINAGQTATIPYTADAAGVVNCTVNLNGQFGTAVAGIGTNQLDALEAEPADFDAFWQNQVARSNAIPLNAQVNYYRGNGVTNTYKFSLSNIDNRRIHGYMTIPTGGGTYPAMITLPAYGEGANLTQPDEFGANLAQVIAVSVSIHNADPSSVDPNAYRPNEITNRENYYYKQAIIGVKRVIDYIHTRADFDQQNIILAGVSQGGGLATIVAGLDQRVDLIVQSNPALARHLGPKYNRPGGFPYYIWQSRVQNGTPSHETSTINAAKYYDAIYFAKRYKKPALTIVGYQDVITPPDGTFAINNQFRDKTIFLHSLKTGHNHPGEYWNGRYDVIRRFIPSTRQPQYPALGYVANAGEDARVATGGVLNLNGQMVDNYNVLNNLAVKWEMVEGPGTVNFSNADRYNTNATFSTDGRYVLRFSGNVTDKLAGESKYYTIADHIVVQVGEGGDTGGGDGGGTDGGGGDNGGGGDGGGNGGGDGGTTNLVNTNLNFLSFDQWGNIDVQVTFSRPSQGLQLSDFEVDNGALIGISGWGQFYFIKIQPIGNRVEVSLPAETTKAINDGAFNTASDVLVIEIENTDGGGGNNGEITCQNLTDGGEVRGNESSCTEFTPTTITNVSLPTGGSGEIEYQWQSSAAGENGPWTDISNSNQLEYTPSMITQTTWYRRIAKRNNCGDFTGISNVVVKQVTLTNDSETVAVGNYCALRADQPWWQWIQKVQIGNFVQYSNKEGYGDFTNKQVELSQGNTYNIELFPGFTWERYDEYWRVWIDYNQDGDFEDADEMVFSGNGQDNQIGTITVPTSTRTGITRMRVAMRNGVFAEPCSSFTFGEVEDYTVMLKNDAPSDYCTARANQPWNQWIAQVQVADLNNYSGKEGYADFTNRSATVTSGQIYTMNLRPAFSYGSFDMHWQVWVDYNQDGDFTDAGERVVSTSSDQPVVTEIFIPEYAAPGITRMRVTARTGAFADACGDFPYGEVEDYNVVIRECASNRGNLQRGVLELTTWRSKRAVELTWVTNTEYKNDYFAVQRSADGENFTEIQRYESLSDLYLAPNNYNFTDSRPLYGMNYYRIKQVYKDGLFRYSSVVELDFDLDVSRYVVFPNPTMEELFVNLPNQAGKSARLLLVNALGQQVEELQIDEIPNYPLRMPLGNLQHGVYQLYLQVADGVTKVETIVIGK